MVPSAANLRASGLICRIYDGVLSADAWPGILGEVIEDGVIKALFAKTRTQTRSALVRLALTVNLPIDPERRTDPKGSRSPGA